MAARLFYAATALLAGLLAVLLLDLVLGSPGALAQERKNCPPGFVWERWSANGCSQETLPPHGYIDYDGWGTCEAGYKADIEQRPTTDGQPPPGSPRTSFPYLKACVSITTGVAGVGGTGFAGIAGDIADKLYSGGGGPSKGTLAGIGAGVTAFLAAAVGMAARWSGAVAGSVLGATGRSTSASTSATGKKAELRRHYRQLESELRAIQRRRDEAYARWKRLGDRLGSARIYRYGVGRILRHGLLVGFNAYVAYHMSVSRTQKVIFFLVSYTITAQTGDWPPSCGSLVSEIDRLTPKVAAARQKMDALNAQYWKKAEEVGRVARPLGIEGYP
jgi:hypothetical protein